MGVTAELYPEVLQTQHPAEPLCPEKVCAAFIQRDDVIVGYLGKDPFLFAPDTGPVWPLCGFVAVLKKLHPCLSIAAGQSLHVMLNFEQRVTGLTAVDYCIERIAFFALLVDALKPGLIFHMDHPLSLTGSAGICLLTVKNI